MSRVSGARKRPGLVPGWWMRADFVVAESLRGLDERRLFVVPGWRYKMLVRAIQGLPRPLIRWATSRVRKPRL